MSLLNIQPLTQNVLTPTSQSDAIEKIYKSMSLVVQAITKENQTINEEIKKIHAELSYIKTDTESSVTTVNIELGNLHQTVVQLRENVESMSLAICQNSLLKQILDTRTQLLQSIQANTATLRKEILDVKRLKDDIYFSAKETFTQHTEALNERFEQLLKEQRLATAQYARKSSDNEYIRKITELSDRIAALELRRTDVPPITPLAPL